ncbi:MAG: FtsX-like permease family protein [Erysipelotrichaceae bacterium]|nr:FtsX-like permease family protein [Erysipelotrichaceae bacterium]
MRAELYPKLAWDGIRKNKRFYLPYILTCIGMIMMFYIIHYLAAMQTLSNMPGGGAMEAILGFGVWVIVLFAAIFLFYTNSFLMRRRQKEFGLYNMLGMGKNHLSILLFWENLILFIISMFLGLLGGILLSKMAELFLTMLIGGEVTYTLRIDMEAFKDTWIIFISIFVLIFTKGLFQIRTSSAIALIKSENYGEKPPKANYLLGIAGIIILAVAYYIALSIKSPLTALSWFFIAVCMVIIATYLLFICGSVMLCKLLQKNKNYYYKPNHFVSVSSMAYRMKRNGAGLASICILSTMVLVIMMGSGSLYVGKEDSLNNRYPHDFTISVDYLTEGDSQLYSKEKEDAFYAQIDNVLNNLNVPIQNKETSLSTNVTGLLYNGKLILDPYTVDGANTDTMEYVTQIYLVSLDEYNQSMDTQKTLNNNEVFIYCVRRTYDNSTITLSDGTTLTVKEQLSSMMNTGESAMLIIPSVFIVTNDIDSLIKSFNKELGDMPQKYLCRLESSYLFDTDLSDKQQIELAQEIHKQIIELDSSDNSQYYSYSIECKAQERDEFYGTFGGIFFLGIFLSIIFLSATVLIIYYKQITEGYEDEARFEIMRKVGMTAQDIRNSINSQMLTVFFLPLAIAAIHTAFAFSIVQKLLAIFNLYNTTLSLMVTLVTIVIFGIFYGIVYKITSNAYYTIVSGNKNE